MPIIALIVAACHGCLAGAWAPNISHLAQTEEATEAAANAVASLAAVTGNQTALALVSVHPCLAATSNSCTWVGCERLHL